MANSARVSVRERATDKTCACERATDKMSESWPGILTTRWPGAKERLAWLTQSGRGEHDPNLTMADLYGDIPREFPPGSGEIMDSGYRDGGYKPDASEVARACTAPDMPADAALFFALAPVPRMASGAVRAMGPSFNSSMDSKCRSGLTPRMPDTLSACELANLRLRPVHNRQSRVRRARQEQPPPMLRQVEHSLWQAPCCAVSLP